MYTLFITTAVYVLPLLTFIGFIAFCIGTFKDVTVNHQHRAISGLSPVLIRRGGWAYALSLTAFTLLFKLASIQILTYLVVATAIPALTLLTISWYRRKEYRFIPHDKDRQRQGGHKTGWQHFMHTTWLLLAICLMWTAAAAIAWW